MQVYLVRALEMGILSALFAVLKKIKYIEMIHQVIGYFGVEQIFYFLGRAKNIFCS